MCCFQLSLMVCLTAFLTLEAEEKMDAAEVLGFFGHGWERYLELFESKDIQKFGKESGADEIIRIVWVPTFDNPVMLEAVSNNNQWTLKKKVLSGKGGYNWGVLKATFSVTISNIEAKPFETLRVQKPWEPLNLYELSIMSALMDGTRYRVEYWTPKVARLIFLRSPECLAGETSDKQVRDPDVYLSLFNFMRNKIEQSSK